MDTKGKSAIIFGLTAVLLLAAFVAVAIAHTNPQGKQTHPVGLETESCQDALAGAEEQLADRGSINPRLLDNIEDKCGVECSIEFDAAREPVLVCGDELCKTDAECDDGNPCTLDYCILTGPRAGCIYQIPVEPTPCEIDRYLGMCLGDICVPKEAACYTEVECEQYLMYVREVSNELCESGFVCETETAFESKCICP